MVLVKKKLEPHTKGDTGFNFSVFLQGEWAVRNPLYHFLLCSVTDFVYLNFHKPIVFLHASAAPVKRIYIPAGMH